jgi:hypothetical protein
VITTQLNPGWLEPSAYMEFLNCGFPEQWDRASLEFYAGRSFLGRSTDIGVRAESGRILAGVSYCFRQIRHGADEPLDVCVMSAGTTLPGERGRGHYRQLLETGLDLCRAKSYAAILGFVTRDNASGRGLQRLGAYAIPSFYIVSGHRRTAVHRSRQAPPPPGRLSDLTPAWSRTADGDQVRFHYATQEEWLRQFTRRPHPVRAVRVSHDATAILEGVGSTDRLQWLDCPRGKTVATLARLAAASAAARRNFFMYTLDPLLAGAASRLGLSIRAGLLMLLPVDRDRTDWHRLARAEWSLHSGDRL